MSLWLQNTKGRLYVILGDRALQGKHTQVDSTDFAIIHPDCRWGWSCASHDLSNAIIIGYDISICTFTECLFSKGSMLEGHNI